MSESTGGKLFSLRDVIVLGLILLIITFYIISEWSSHGRSKEYHNYVTCMTNMRSLATAFTMYTQDNDDQYPGNRGDSGGDWLGYSNQNKDGTLPGRCPEDGVIFKYTGKEKNIYRCPADDSEYIDSATKRKRPAPFSYTAMRMFAGSSPEYMTGAHYRQSADPDDPLNYNPTDHRKDMKRFNGVPLILEEHLDFSQASMEDGSWLHDDSMVNRHLPTQDALCAGANAAFTDGHAEMLRLPARDHRYPTWQDQSPRAFIASSICIRKSDGSLANDAKIDPEEGTYGCFPDRIDAEHVQHEKADEP